MRRVVSLWLPRFATDRWFRTPSPKGGRRRASRVSPFALVRSEQGRLVLAAVNGAAAEAGLAPGLPLADGRALLPELRVAESAPEDDAEALDRLAQWCGRYTPWTAVDPSGDPAGGAGILLEVTGCAHLFGGETALLADLVKRVERLGFTARAALAETPGAAWAAARFATAPLAAGRRPPFTVLPPGRARAALADLPPAALRLSPACCELLDRLGLRRIGDLYGLPPAGLTPRLGEELLRRLRQALGAAPEPISPRTPVTPQLARRIFPEPIATAEDIARALNLLALGLCRRLDRAQLGARRLELSLYRVDGSWRRWMLGTSRPSRDPAHLTRLFANHLDKIDPGFGIEVMTLAAPVTETLSALQLVLPGARTGARTGTGTEVGIGAGIGARTESEPHARARIPAPTTASDELAGLVDRLASRLGSDRLWALAPVESHLPERAVRPAPPLEAPAAAAWRRWRGGRPPRPLRLLSVPEPIEAMALLPDHPPARFRWRRVPHTVTRAEGPERLAPEWWRDGQAETLPRDYFRVEDQAGRRYWLYRAGQDWFLHGLFG